MRSEAAAATKAFDEALDDDLNTAEALAAVFEYVRDTNTAMDAGEFLAGNAVAAGEFLNRFDSVFDVLRPSASAGGLSDAEIDALVARAHGCEESARFRGRRPDPQAISRRKGSFWKTPKKVCAGNGNENRNQSGA